MGQRRRRTARTAGMVVAAALLGAVAAVGVGALRSPHTDRDAPDHRTSAPAAPTVASSTVASSTVASSTVASSTVVPSAPGAPSAGTSPVPLRLTDDVRAQLVAAFVADGGYGYRSSWVTGLRPATSFYAVVPATGVQLAWVTFEASPSAPEWVHVALQDAGSRTALQRAPGGPWKVYDICRTPEFLALTGGVLPAGGHCPTP